MKKIISACLIVVLLSSCAFCAPNTQKITTKDVHNAVVKVVSWIRSWF